MTSYTVLLPDSYIDFGDPLYECVAFTVEDPFDESMPPKREHVFVFACDDEDALDQSDHYFHARPSNVLNWFAQEVLVDSPVYADVFAQATRMPGRPLLDLLDAEDGQERSDNRPN